MSHKTGGESISVVE